VHASGVRFAYPNGREILGGVDFSIAGGERVAVLGPNGAGKTTLALHLNGVHLPTSGTVEVGGVMVDRNSVREVRRRVGMVFQDPDDQLFMPTVGEDVAFGPANYGVVGTDLADRVDRALAQVGLADAAGIPPHHLSFGQRRRAAIATVLAMDVDVLVLDEPTSNVDPRGRRDLVETLARLDVTMVVITHDLPFALELCQRSIVLDEGRVVADGSTRDLFADAALMAEHGLELPWGFGLSIPDPETRPSG
jgi:cobalt/nickel transport system ATP-binding protein